MSSLVFIDTNILLDFYRVRGREKGLSILSHLDGNHERIITGSQVEMEFKNNRQRVILEAHSALKAVRFQKDGNLPVFLLDSKQSSKLKKSEEIVKTLGKTLQDRTERVLRNPTRHDVVYKIAQRLFRSASPYNLARDNPIRFTIQRLARKRFFLGYPPRKATDTSVGDAINWEWIIHCANESGKDIVLVSRDSDYGISLSDSPVLNDFLGQEFKERVGRKRKLTFTDRLSTGLKAANIVVTRQEVEGEEKFLSQRSSGTSLLQRSIFPDLVGRYQRQLDLLSGIVSGIVPLQSIISADELSAIQKSILGAGQSLQMLGIKSQKEEPGAESDS